MLNAKVGRFNLNLSLEDAALLHRLLEAHPHSTIVCTADESARVRDLDRRFLPFRRLLTRKLSADRRGVARRIVEFCHVD